MSSDQTTPRPWAWRNFGGEWMLCGTAGGAPVVLATLTGRAAGEPFAVPAVLAVRDGVPPRLVELTPDHPDAAFILLACNSFDPLADMLENAIGMLAFAIADGYRSFPPSQVAALGRHVAALKAIRAAKQEDKPGA